MVYYDSVKENLPFRKQLIELQKENEFLKKRSHSLRRKSIRDSVTYSEVQQEIGGSMAMRSFPICPNVCYHYLKKRKADYHRQKKEINDTMEEIYRPHSK